MAPAGAFIRDCQLAIFDGLVTQAIRGVEPVSDSPDQRRRVQVTCLLKPDTTAGGVKRGKLHGRRRRADELRIGRVTAPARKIATFGLVVEQTEQGHGVEELLSELPCQFVVSRPARDQKRLGIILQNEPLPGDRRDQARCHEARIFPVVVVNDPQFGASPAQLPCKKAAGQAQTDEEEVDGVAAHRGRKPEGPGYMPL